MSEPFEDNDQDRVLKAALQHRVALESYAFGLLRNHSEAQDVVQDAFIVISKKWQEFEAGTSMMAWSRAIVRRKVLESLKRRKRLEKIQDRLLNDAVESAFEQVHDSSRAGNLQDMERRLSECLQKLTDRSRSLLSLVYWEKKSYAEASEASSMEVEAVRKSLYRAKSQLRECVALNTGGAS